MYRSSFVKSMTSAVVLYDLYQIMAYTIYVLLNFFTHQKQANNFCRYIDFAYEIPD